MSNIQGRIVTVLCCVLTRFVAATLAVVAQEFGRASSLIAGLDATTSGDAVCGFQRALQEAGARAVLMRLEDPDVETKELNLANHTR